MITDTKARVYQWLLDHADGDGFVLMSSPTIAHRMGRNTRTVQGALASLEKANKIVLFAPSKFAVIDLARDGDEL